MLYRYLGQSGLLVSRICLGTMTFGMKDWGCDQKTANAIVRHFIDQGGQFIDTADMYSAGLSEEMLGNALKNHHREDLVIASKCWFRTGEGANDKGLSRKHIFDAVEKSLKRLKMDYLDLYQVHGPDWFTPMEETMSALDDLVRQGKIRYIGCSNYYAWQIVKANSIAEKHGKEKFISAQHLYNLVRRDIENEILPACVDQGLGMLCWSPLAGGFLSGKYGRDQELPEGSRISFRKNIDVPRYFSDQAFDVIDELKTISKEIGKTPSQISLAWLLFDRRVTSVIIGPKNVEQLKDTLEVADWNLEQEFHQRLETKLELPSGYPMEWVELGFGNISGKEEFKPDHYRFPLQRN